MDTKFFKKKEKKVIGPTAWNTYPDIGAALACNKHTVTKWLATLPMPVTEEEYRVYAQLANRFHIEYANTDDEGNPIIV